MFSQIQKEYEKFLKEADLSRDELFIPTIIDNMSKSGLATIKVYPNKDKWYGITYREDFPGLNHLYLRLDWADLQPEADKFDWTEIDEVMDEWGKKGYRFAIRVCCSETSERQCFATPKWLYDMGCGGGFYPPLPSEDAKWWERVAKDPYMAKMCEEPEKYCHKYWEPDYAEPMFLDYLERFIKAFAEKFDNDPRVEYVDLGSYGNWGEGHNALVSNRVTPIDVYKEHVRIHMQYFKNKPVIVNDDFINMIYGDQMEDVWEWCDGKQELLDDCVSKGMGLRDDSILAGNYYIRDFHTMASPELFDYFYQQAPIDIEAGHYTSYTEENSKGGLVLIEAAKRAHATYAGFHGYIDDWLKDNLYITEYLANRLGYWYFINEIEHAQEVNPGTKMRVTMKWENAGFGLCYNKYDLEMKLTAESGKEYVFSLSEFDNRKIMSQSTRKERLFALLDENMESGIYTVSFRLSETVDGKLNTIKMGIKKEFLDCDGFYRISEIKVKGTKK